MERLYEPQRGEAARWYFQDAAIRAALEKIAQGGKRILLSLATGTGKTIIVVQLLHKLAQAGQLRRALFVCDRDELRTQRWAKMHAVFGDNAKIVTTSDPQKNARILIASYQTLNITDADAEPRFWREETSRRFQTCGRLVANHSRRHRAAHRHRPLHRPGGEAGRDRRSLHRRPIRREIVTIQPIPPDPLSPR